MVGTILQKRRHLNLFGWVSILAAAGSGVALIWIGPLWAGTAAVVGLLAIIASWGRDFWAERHMALQPLLISFLVVHVFLIGTAATLHRLFLSGLSDEVLKIPSLSSRMHDPNNVFSVAVPDRWVGEPVATPHQSGIRFRPQGPDTYMGSLEAVIMVRRLDSPPDSVRALLEKTAASLMPSSPRSGALFSFRTEPAELLGGNPGIWTEMEAKKFWVPVRQVTLFGIKNRRYLCSVSTSGLKSHSTLFRVLCLGLFETIRFESGHAVSRKTP